MRTVKWFQVCATAALLSGSATAALAQAPDPDTRESVIEDAQADKATKLQPYVPSKGEQVVTRIESTLLYSTSRWRPYFENAYRGGGFALGVAYMHHVSAYNFIDVRGSYSIRSYKRAEAEFVVSSAVSPPRKAVGHRRLARGDAGRFLRHGNLDFPRRSHELRVAATVRIGSAHGQADEALPDAHRRRRVEPGVAAARTGLVSVGRVRLHARNAPRTWRRANLPADAGHGRIRLAPCARLRASWRVLWRDLHDYNDRDEAFGFRRIDYEVIQHVPILRESVDHLAARPAFDHLEEERSGHPVLPAAVTRRRVDLRGFYSWRFRDRQQSPAASRVADYR